MTGRLGLGLDAGGTHTRWALADGHGAIVAEGEVGGMTALQMATDTGRARIRAVLADLAESLPAAHRAGHVCAGMTGYTQGGDDIRALMSAALKVEPACIALHTDIEIAYHDLFQPGQGYVVYAGTGTVAAFIDDDGTFHRAGGRGAILDDAGGGFWIAVEALRHVWRQEDVHPGAWRDSPMAVTLFDALGGAEWDRTKDFIYTRERGDIGSLALAVAAAADADPVAHDILLRAGQELARLAQAMLARHGQRPVALAGRAVTLHPVIEEAFRASIPGAPQIDVRVTEAHAAAARIAARAARAANP